MKFKEYKKTVDPDATFGYNGDTKFKSGKDNPAYNHGGKLSPFSKKFIHSDKISIDDVIKKVKETKRLHPERDRTKIEYWLKKTNGDAETNGYTLYTIWESEYNKLGLGCLDEIIRNR